MSALREGVILPALPQLRLGEAVAVAVAVGSPCHGLHGHVEVDIRLAAMLERPGFVYAGPIVRVRAHADEPKRGLRAGPTSAAS